MITFSNMLITIAHIILVEQQNSSVTVELTSGRNLREWFANPDDAQARASELRDIISSYGKHS